MLAKILFGLFSLTISFNAFALEANFNGNSGLLSIPYLEVHYPSAIYLSSDVIQLYKDAGIAEEDIPYFSPKTQLFYDVVVKLNSNQSWSVVSYKTLQDLINNGEADLLSTFADYWDGATFHVNTGLLIIPEVSLGSRNNLSNVILQLQATWTVLDIGIDIIPDSPKTTIKSTAVPQSCDGIAMTQEKFDQLTPGMNIKDIARIIGCAGHINTLRKTTDSNGKKGNISILQSNYADTPYQYDFTAAENPEICIVPQLINGKLTDKEITGL